MKNFIKATILAIGTCSAADTGVITGGEIHLMESFKFGRFVTSMRGPAAKGTVASFYTMQLDAQDDPYFDAAVPYGMDLEVSPSWNPLIKTKIHTNSHNYDEKWEPLIYPERFESQEWHKYEIDWTPHYIAFKIDDREVRRQEFTNTNMDQGR